MKKNLTWEDIKECERIQKEEGWKYFFYAYYCDWIELKNKVDQEDYSIEELKLMLLQQQLEKLK